MSICESGVDCKLQGAKIVVMIKNNHPLIRLGQLLPWRELTELILPDLKSGERGRHWWLGRKL